VHPHGALWIRDVGPDHIDLRHVEMDGHCAAQLGMSALGQTRTWRRVDIEKPRTQADRLQLGRVLINRDWSAARVDRLSALPPKADMCGATRDVRFGPKADITAAT
jgi:hypothetical protein